METSRTIEDLFSEALMIENASRREQFVQTLRAQDIATAEEVATLLAAHAAAGTFMASADKIPDSRAASPFPAIPGFRIERELGAGGVGRVYQAWDEKLHRKVAIKVLRHQDNAANARLVLDEARKIAALRDPAILTIHSVLDEQTPPAIVMDLVEGFPLDQFTEGLNLQQKARVLQEIARALAVAHKRRIIHRDIKPANILLTPSLKPVILDFGLAISTESAPHPDGGFAGTPLYASPEQAAAEPLTPASDVFSFGCVMFKFLTGRPPFPGNNLEDVLRAIRESAPPFLRDLAHQIPEDLQAICLACLAKDPAERPAAEEVALDLGRFLAGEPARLRPALYSDILRKRISAHTSELRSWERQGMISQDETDRLHVVHRRILADEDHWIIDARRLTWAQSILYTSTWMVVVAVGLLAWLVRDELSPVLRWLLPVAGAAGLLGMGIIARRRGESLASASFLAGAVLSSLPATLATLAELHWFGTPRQGVEQLLEGIFTNQQILLGCVVAGAISIIAFWRLRMTGFAWTTCVLLIGIYAGLLLQWNWWGQLLHIKALWLLPLSTLTLVGLWYERKGRIRWAMPFHLAGLAILVGSLNAMAIGGHTLLMIGVNPTDYLDDKRLLYFSFALNGLIFLGLMVAVERARSLDLRRGSRLLEVIAILHLLGPLYLNAMEHANNSKIDVSVYLGAVALLLGLGPWRARWRTLLGGLSGVAFGSYLLIHLELVSKLGFVIALGGSGLGIALITYVYLRWAPKRTFTSRD